MDELRYAMRVRPKGMALTKLLACLAVALLLTGCLPIGARVSNMYSAGASQSAQGAP